MSGTAIHDAKALVQFALTIYPLHYSKELLQSYFILFKTIPTKYTSYYISYNVIHQIHTIIILFHTDNNIIGNERLNAYFTTSLTDSLARFSTHITRLEVYLADENGTKEGRNDQRCTIEARMEGLQPVAVTNHADTIEQAVKGATDKLKSALESILGRLKTH
jgi:hypothetical protein